VAKQIPESLLDVWRRTQALRKTIDESNVALLTAHRDLVAAEARFAAELEPLLPDVVDPPVDPPDDPVVDPPKVIGAQGVLAQRDFRLWDPFEISSGDRLKDTRFHNFGWTGMHHGKGAGPLDDFEIRNCILDDGDKWLSRAYRMRGLPGKPIVVSGCTLSNCRTEHGFYWNLAGGGGPWPAWLGDDAPTLDMIAILIELTHFEHIGSQAIQFVGVPGREAETPEPELDGAAGGVVVVRDVTARDIGWNHGGSARASYALSFFPTPHALYLENVEVDNSEQNLSALAISPDTDHGALLIEDRTKAVCRNVRALFQKTTRPIANFKRVAELVLDGCHFEATGGQPWISITGPTKVSIRNCTGNVRVHLNRNDVGAITDNLELSS